MTWPIADPTRRPAPRGGQGRSRSSRPQKAGRERRRASGKWEQGHDRGFALITVLWLALILGLIAASLAGTARLTSQNAREIERAHSLDHLLNATFETAIWQIMTGRTGQTLPDGAAYADGALRVTDTTAIRVIDSRGLVDLNAANPETISRLTRGISIADTSRQSLISARESGQVELSLLDLPPTSRRALERISTSYSGLTNPDLTFAPREIFAALTDFSNTEIDAVFDKRRAAPGHAEPGSYAPPAGFIPAQGAILPRGPVYHMRIAVRDGDLVTGRAFVIFIPLPESRNTKPWFLLHARSLPDDAAEMTALTRAAAQ